MTNTQPPQSRITALFPLWALLFSALACLFPGFFTGAIAIGDLSLGLPRMVSPLLMVIMFCMGLTLTPADFAEVARRPHRVLLGVALQFGLMPAAAWLVATLLGLPAEMAVGLIVVGATAGGTAANRLWGHWLARREQWLALMAMACIVVVIATIVALNRDQLFVTGPLVALAVVLHNLIGLTSGYWGARLLGCDRRDARTIAIEVGMQNSGLAAVLATKYFGAAAGLPGAIFSIWHNISGSLLAGYWARRGGVSD